jgi:hypothetical protein
MDDVIKRNRWTKKRQVGHAEGLPKLPGYNKAMTRCIKRSKQLNWAVTP